MGKFATALTCLALSSPCLAQKPNWVQVKTKSVPQARCAHAMVYDFARRRTLLFGGLDDRNNVLADTWEYDGQSWRQIKSMTSPPARHSFVMAYDSNRRRATLFGGIAVGSVGGLWDTWEWDGRNWARITRAIAPSARTDSAMAYDSARRRMVLFGGVGVTSAIGLADTWEWDGRSWTRITPTTSPPFHAGHVMAYDSTRKRVLLFGGSGRYGWRNDTWEYDGRTWTQMKPAMSPSPRSKPALIYDTARQRMVLFGGLDRNGYRADTWEYDGKTWTRLTPMTMSSGRDYAGLAYDPARQRAVLFGGRLANNSCVSDTWEYGSPTLTASPPTISIATGGTHALLLNAGTPNASRLYWVFGSVTGTSPGITLASAAGSVTIPLNPDIWTDITIGFANGAILSKTRGTLDRSGQGTAAVNVPKNLPTAAIGAKLYHAYLVYDAKNNFYMASDPVELMLVK